MYVYILRIVYTLDNVPRPFFYSPDREKQQRKWEVAGPRNYRNTYALDPFDSQGEQRREDVELMMGSSRRHRHLPHYEDRRDDGEQRHRYASPYFSSLSPRKT